MEKLYKISVWLPDQTALNEVLTAAAVSLDCGAPHRESDGSFRVTLYATPTEASKVTALPYRHEVDEHFSEALQRAHDQVSKTDRFQGGKIKPTGLGVKR